MRTTGARGANEVAFSGRVNGQGLHGSYRATAVATDPAGNASSPSGATFTVLSR